MAPAAVGKSGYAPVATAAQMAVPRPVASAINLVTLQKTRARVDLVPAVTQSWWSSYLEDSPVPVIVTAGGHPSQSGFAARMPGKVIDRPLVQFCVPPVAGIGQHERRRRLASGRLMPQQQPRLHGRDLARPLRQLRPPAQRGHDELRGKRFVRAAADDARHQLQWGRLAILLLRAGPKAVLRVEQ